ncbi:hypothetical protein AAVH_22415 [Aphelenchoides avenae]|nr:hypothetical protein AAVH_22415 [Aphelenchus avenae]
MDALIVRHHAMQSVVDPLNQAATKAHLRVLLLVATWENQSCLLPKSQKALAMDSPRKELELAVMSMPSRQACSVGARERGRPELPPSDVPIGAGDGQPEEGAGAGSEGDAESSSVLRWGKGKREAGEEPQPLPEPPKRRGGGRRRGRHHRSTTTASP